MILHWQTVLLLLRKVITFKNYKTQWEFPFWHSRLRTWHCFHEDMGLISGLTQWVKDLALPQAVAWAENAACIGVAMAVTYAGLSCSSNLIPSLGTSICWRSGWEEKKKKRHNGLNYLSSKFNLLLIKNLTIHNAFSYLSKEIHYLSLGLIDAN